MNTPAPTVHNPVLLGALLSHLPDDLSGHKIVDCTLGGGGYTTAFLERGAHVLACDKDDVAILRAEKNLVPTYPNLTLFHGNFADLKDALSFADWDNADAIVADLGLSSDQLDTPERGFSFNANGPLDMRMGQKRDDVATAADILNTWDEQALFVLFKKFADEPRARPLVKKILVFRGEKLFETTQDFVNVIEQIYPYNPALKRRHPAQRLFQAVRMAVNTEEADLENLLTAAPSVLAENGQIMVVTFHSVEDRMVKAAFRPHCAEQRDAYGRTVAKANFHQPIRKIVADEVETEANPRARSATLRILKQGAKV